MHSHHNESSGKIEERVRQAAKNAKSSKYCRESSDCLSNSPKRAEMIIRPNTSRLNSNKNFRYERQSADEDSDEPDVPNETPIDSSSIKMNDGGEETEMNSISQYQTISRRLEMLNVSEKNKVNFSSHFNNNQLKLSTVLKDELFATQNGSGKILRIPDTIEKQISPVKVPCQNPEIDIGDFKLDGISEFDF